MKLLSNLSAFLTGRSRRIFISGRSESVYCGSLRENDIVGGIAHAIANNVGKLAPQVLRHTAAGDIIKNDKLSKLLCLRPNAENSTFDFLYRLGSDLVYNSNAFAVIFFNDDFSEITSIQPITTMSHKIFEVDGVLYFRFVWEYDKKSYTVPYQFVIHLKSRYNRKRFLGTPPDAELQSSTELLGVTYNGIKNVINNSASLRGYLKYNNFIDDAELRKKVSEFQSAYMAAENEGGIAGLDNTMEFKEITQKPPTIPITQVNFFRDNMYRYYGVNDKILNSTATPEEWNAFYENVIEPIAIQLSLEFTFKVFTENERNYGNKILFTTDRLQYASLETREAVAGNAFDRGAISINEYRNAIYLPPIEGGDVRMVSLNYVKVDEQSEYQIGKKSETETEPPADVAKVVRFIKCKLKEGEESA